MKIKKIKLGIVSVLVAVFTVVALAPATNAASLPVGSYAAGDRVLKELIRKCENGKTVSSQKNRERCRVIVTYLNHTDSKTKCNIVLSFKAKKAKLDEASVHDCRVKVDKLNPNPPGGASSSGGTARNKCGNIETYFDFGTACQGSNSKAAGENNPLFRLLLVILAWTSALVVVSVIGGIVYGGFLYLSARDSSSQTQKGITVIINSVVALVAWVFLYGLINFIVPGGLFRG